MKKIFSLCFIVIYLLQGILIGGNGTDSKIITSTKQIYLPNFPGAYNPSIVKFNDKYLLTFRYLPNRIDHPWLSYIGVVLLDDNFDPVSNTQLLDTRFNNTIPSQCEDARIISHNGKLYLIYNDNTEIQFPSVWDRRDMYIAELILADKQFVVSEPLKLFYENKYYESMWQKNWSPFVWNGMLLLSYSINSHEILLPDLKTGHCQLFSCLTANLPWTTGSLRGGTPAILVDDEYLAFFHSSLFTASSCSQNKEMWHYYMGAYTFSPEPPFQITKISPDPLEAPGFYTYSKHEKRVIYPGGFVVNGSNIHIAYGKDDSELWIATININKLKQSMIPVKKEN